MSSTTSHEQTARRPDLGHPPTNSYSDDTIEIEELEDESGEEKPQDDRSKQPQPQAATPQDELSEPEERPRTPAYVAPIGNISPIPPISPPTGLCPPPDRLQLPEYVGRFLVGKKVNEDGDVVDGESHQVLAHASGDLPSLVGRPISNWKGDILGDSGELLGWIEDLELGRSRASPKPPRAPRSLFELLGQRSAGLMVDENQNLIDTTSGKVVGTYFDNNNPQHRKAKEAREAWATDDKKRGADKQPEGQAECSSAGKAAEGRSTNRPVSADDATSRDEHRQSGERRSESERRRNAESWRKENPGESPSDIFLDVKSTTEGIQLTIRIPTVFGGQQVKPNISFS